MSAHPTPRGSHSSEQPDDDDLSATELFDLFGDEYTRRVYAAVAARPRCGRAVAEAADVSRATAYRRLNDLRDAGLVRTEVQFSANGHHRKRFETVATSVSVSLDDDGLDVTVDATD
jgi:predicted transcriptional regulator